MKSFWIKSSGIMWQENDPECSENKKICRESTKQILVNKSSSWRTKN